MDNLYRLVRIDTEKVTPTLVLKTRIPYKKVYTRLRDAKGARTQMRNPNLKIEVYNYSYTIDEEL